MDRTKRGRILLRWGPAVAVMLVIFLLSATPSNELPNFGGVDTLIKKGAHMLGYALLMLCFLRALSRTTGSGKLPVGIMALSVALVVVYAMSDEFHQSFVPGRNSRWTDVGIDTIGGMAAMVLWSLIPTLRKIASYRLFPPSP